MRKTVTKTINPDGSTTITTTTTTTSGDGAQEGLNLFLLVGSIFAIVGICIMAGGVFVSSRSKAFMAAAVPLPVTVVEIQRKRNSDRDGYVYRPVLSAVARGGEVIEYAHPVWANPPAHREAGMVVDGYLDRDSGRVETERTLRQGGFIKWFLYLFGGVFAVLGLIFAAVGLRHRAARRRADNPYLV